MSHSCITSTEPLFRRIELFMSIFFSLQGSFRGERLGCERKAYQKMYEKTEWPHDLPEALGASLGLTVGTSELTNQLIWAEVRKWLVFVGAELPGENIYGASPEAIKRLILAQQAISEAREELEGEEGEQPGLDDLIKKATMIQRQKIETGF